jgi:hypothetical protein
VGKEGDGSGMTVIGYRTREGVGEEIGKGDPQILVKGGGLGGTSRSKSKDAANGATTNFEAVDAVYRHKSFGGRQRRFGHLLERMRLETSPSDSKSQIELAVRLITEQLQELQDLISGDLFNLGISDTGADNEDHTAISPEAIIFSDSQAASTFDQTVADIAGMLQNIEDISPGFIDSLKGDFSTIAADHTASDQVTLLELLEELYEQVDLAIDRIAADHSAEKFDHIDLLQAQNDSVADAIEGLKELISAQIDQIEIVVPGFLSEAKSSVERDLTDIKASHPSSDLHDALEELSELLEDLVVLLSNNFADDNSPVTDILRESKEEATSCTDVNRPESAGARGDTATTQDDRRTFMDSNNSELEAVAVEVFMGIYEQLSDAAKSEVAQILAGIVYDDQVLS